MEKNKRILAFLAVVGLVVLLLMALAMKIGKGKGSVGAESADTAAGIAYLEQLEAGDPAEVDATLREYHAQELQTMREERMRQVESGELSVWTLFEDYVILGDSRAVGFYIYEYLPEERVLAEGGSTIRELQAHIPDLVTLQPSRIFVCYGLNDVSIGYWDTPEEYVTEFKQIIGEIRQVLPDLEIYISSTLPANEVGLITEPLWAEIPNFNIAVETMCKELGCIYVDNDEICREHADLWNYDGIHVGRDFYPYWAANLIDAVYAVGLEQADGATAACSADTASPAVEPADEEGST